MSAATGTPTNLTVRRASTDALLDALVVLTHQIHATRSDPSGLRDHANDLRAQRDLVRGELLRRAGE